MTTTLITGANKGLGFETARQLVAAGHTVWIGSRDAERGRRAAERLGARSVPLDVTDDASVAAARGADWWAWRRRSSGRRCGAGATG